MSLIRAGDNDGIDILGIDHGQRIRRCVGCTCFIGDGLQALCISIADILQFNAGGLTAKYAGVVGTHNACTD